MFHDVWWRFVRPEALSCLCNPPPLTVWRRFVVRGGMWPDERVVGSDGTVFLLGRYVFPPPMLVPCWIVVYFCAVVVHTWWGLEVLLFPPLLLPLRMLLLLLRPAELILWQLLVDGDSCWSYAALPVLTRIFFSSFFLVLCFCVLFFFVCWVRSRSLPCVGVVHLVLICLDLLRRCQGRPCGKTGFACFGLCLTFVVYKTSVCVVFCRMFV